MVMGEQGAKSLRGGKMEDVIFAGTSGRAPLGRAEVAVTIDNTDGALPIDFNRSNYLKNSLPQWTERLPDQWRELSITRYSRTS